MGDLAQVRLDQGQPGGQHQRGQTQWRPASGSGGGEPGVSTAGAVQAHSAVLPAGSPAHRSHLQDHLSVSDC